ncbi:MAG: hypothetical protein ABI662_09125 [Dermatophilaceae bacterium]
MKFAPRAVVSMLMLSGVVALAAVSVLAVSMVLLLAASMRGVWAVLAAIAVAGIVIAVGMRVPAARRRQNKPVEGVLITGDEQPLLWVEICIVAEGLHMWPPSELVLAPNATLIASENRTRLGLRPGVRRLQLGEVLLAGLTERQLRAAIAHELCRFWGPSSLARRIHRGRKIIGRVVELVGEDTRVGRVVGRYGRMYIAVADPVIRRQQLEADTRSANLVGNGSTLAALREVAVLRSGWDAFSDGYLAPAAAVQRRPADVFASFTEFIDHPTRRAHLAETVLAPSLVPASLYDSHPSLAERLSVVASLPEDNTHDRSGRAIDMLREPERVIDRVHEWMFQDRELLTGTWDEIAPEADRGAAREGARKLVRLGQEGGMGPLLCVMDLLDIIRYGLSEEMVRPLFGDGAPHEVERQAARRLITAFLTTAAIEAGTVNYVFSWAAPAQLVDSQGEVQDLSALVNAALADEGALGALELWLSAHKVGRDVKLGDDPGPQTTKEDVQAGSPIPGVSLTKDPAADLVESHQPVLVS